MERYIDREIMIYRKIDRGIERKKGIELKKKEKEREITGVGL